MMLILKNYHLYYHLYYLLYYLLFEIILNYMILFQEFLYFFKTFIIFENLIYCYVKIKQHFKKEKTNSNFADRISQICILYLKMYHLLKKYFRYSILF